MKDNPRLPLTTLLTKALNHHIPFTLEVPSSTIPKWTRPPHSYLVWEVSASEYYTGVSQARPITHNAVGTEYAREYKLSVLEILNRPNSTAFFFEGRLLARLASHYGNPGLMSRAMEGPSAAMTLHGSGHLDFSRSTRRESISDPERNVLLGQSRPGGSKTETQYIWPPTVIFQARFLPFDGRWNDDCEKWFLERAENIKGGFVDPKTEGGWWNYFRHSKRCKCTTDDEWRDIETAITTANGDSWEGKRLSEIFDITSPGNDYMDP